MGILKRDYLSSEEKNFYMVAKAFVQYLEGERNLDNKRTEEVWEEWSKRGMATKEMSKNLKLVRTYLKKFCYEVEENLSDQELKKLNKQLMKFDYKLVDDYTFKKLMRDINDNIRYIVLERDKFIDIIEDIAQVRCVGCKDNYQNCVIHKALEDLNVPYGGEQPNCPYAADLSECSEGQLEKINNLKLQIKKKNKFYKE